MVSFKEFVQEAANFNVNASSRPELARFMNRGRGISQQTQAYPVQTQATSTTRYPQPRTTQSPGPMQPPATTASATTSPAVTPPATPPSFQPQQQVQVPPAVTQRNIPVASKNGQLTPQDLKPVGKYNAGPSGRRQWYADNALLSPRAADAFIAAQQAYGRAIPINSAYRNLEHQRGLSGEGHRVVGKAGTSRHGLGMALDLQPNTAHYNWFVKNGPQFGWYYKAIPGDPYHFEFRG